MNTKDARGTVRITIALVNPKVGGNAPIKGNVMRVLTVRGATVSEVADNVRALFGRAFRPFFLIIPK